MNLKKIKVLLADVRHNTVGIHSNCVPIGIGYIGSYLLDQIKNPKIELVLATDPDEVFELIDKWSPDIIGCSNYVWNADLSYQICEYAKKQKENTFCILGGPEFPAGTGQRFIQNTEIDKTYDKCFDYLTKRPAVDYFAFVDGEVAFLEVVNKFIEFNFSVNEIKNNDLIIHGCASISMDKKKLNVGDYIPRIGMLGSVKSEGRDIIPSPYTNGLLDKFLDGKFLPAFETARGCPFLCTFCDQGLDMSKMTTFSVKRLEEELNYVAKKLSLIKGGTKAISIFDSNWGMYEKDVELADGLLKLMDQYDWPQYIECLTPKSNRDNLLKINDKLKNRVALQLSMQSLNDEVLSIIKRKNWTKNEYVDYIHEIKKRGRATSCEMIVPLPGETEQTYYDGVKFLMDHGIQAETYTLMMLCGAELGKDKAINNFGLESKFRILPKQFGNYKGKKIFEIEEVCIATNTMDYQSYLNARNYSFIVKILSQPIFLPIYKLCASLNISWFDFSIAIHKFITDEKYKSKLKDIFNDFCKESKNELFDTKEEAKYFYNDPENYELLLKGQVGENLLVKYTVKSYIAYKDILDVIFLVLNKNFSNKNNIDLSIIKSAEEWMKNVYFIDEIFDENKNSENGKFINLEFDFPEWIINNFNNLNSFKKNISYKFTTDKYKISNIINEMKVNFGPDKERAFGRYLERRGRGKISFLEREYISI